MTTQRHPGDVAALNAEFAALGLERRKNGTEREPLIVPASDVAGAGSGGSA